MKCLTIMQQFMIVFKVETNANTRVCRSTGVTNRPVPEEALPCGDVSNGEGGRRKSGTGTKPSGYSVDTLQLLQLPSLTSILLCAPVFTGTQCLTPVRLRVGALLPDDRHHFPRGP